MNALEIKAVELAEMSKNFGYLPEVDVVADHTAYVDFKNGIKSIITFTNSGKVNVKSFERIGTAKKSIANRDLQYHLAWKANNAVKVEA